MRCMVDMSNLKSALGEGTEVIFLIPLQQGNEETVKGEVRK